MVRVVEKDGARAGGGYAGMTLRQENLCLWTLAALRSSRGGWFSTAAAFADTTVEKEGNQFEGKAAQFPKYTRSRHSILVTNAWLGLLHCKYRICQDIPPWREASREMDRRQREGCIPDDSTIPRGNSTRDNRPVEMATKARNP